ncbi:unnamed protein product [Effrenium voratum]|nr:unnamed protein product [Effrenium voratum]
MEGDESAPDASLSENDVAQAMQTHAGVFTRQMLQKGREARFFASDVETPSGSSPRKRRFYMMTTDHNGHEKALDGAWVDKLQDLLDEAARAYGARSELQDEVMDQEQNEMRTQIGSFFSHFFNNGSEGIDTVMGQLVQVWKCLNSPDKNEGFEAGEHFAGSLAAVLESLQEARDKGCANAEKVMHQWFAYLTKEVFKVERFGEHQKITTLAQLKHRLKLHHTYEELNDRCLRMDTLNAGLEEAVQSKATLQAAVDHAELLLNKQVEAEFQKSFQKETKTLLLQAAKARAEVVGQVENAGRHRAVLRAELLMHATELVEKLRQWHPKICKRYQDAISAMKTSKRQTEDRKKAAEETLAELRAKLEHTRNSLEIVSKPYGGPQIELDESTLHVKQLLTKDALVSRLFAAVAESEEPLVPSTILEAVDNLVSRDPFQKLREMVKVLTLKDTGNDPQVPSKWARLLDFAAVQHRLEQTGVAASELLPFLTAQPKGASLLMRGPDAAGVMEVLQELREVLVDCSMGQTAGAANLLRKAEPVLKLLATANSTGERLRQGCVAAEAALLLALSNLSAMARVQRGCQLFATILSLRALQLRKHALNRILNEPMPTQSDKLREQALSLHASNLAIGGGMQVLQAKAEAMRNDAAAMLTRYSRDVEEILDVAHQLANSRGSAFKPASREASREGGAKDMCSKFADLPAYLACNQGQNGWEGVSGVLDVLKYQKLMLKIHLSTRKWLRAALMPNLKEADLAKAQQVVKALQGFRRRQLTSQSSKEESEEGEGKEGEGQEGQEGQAGQAGQEGQDGQEGEVSEESPPPQPEKRLTSPTGLSVHLHSAKTELPRQLRPRLARSASDLLNDRLAKEVLAQLAKRFKAAEEKYRREARKRSPSRASSRESSSRASSDVSEGSEVSERRPTSNASEAHSEASGDVRPMDSTSSEELPPQKIEPEVPPEVKAMRSQATFLNWSRTRSKSQEKRDRHQLRRGLRLAKAPRGSGAALPPDEPSERVYTDLVGRPGGATSRPATAPGVRPPRAAGRADTSDPQDRCLRPELLQPFGISDRRAASRSASPEHLKLAKPKSRASVPRVLGALGLSSTTLVSVGRSPGRVPTAADHLESSEPEEDEEEEVPLAPLAADVQHEEGEEPAPVKSSSSRVLVEDQQELQQALAAMNGRWGKGRVSTVDPIPDPEGPEWHPTEELSIIGLQRSPSETSPKSPSSIRGVSTDGHSRSMHSSRKFAEALPPKDAHDHVEMSLDPSDWKRPSVAKLLAEKAPCTGRAFPSTAADFQCSGPPGTARRMKLHDRPSSPRKNSKKGTQDDGDHLDAEKHTLRYQAIEVSKGLEGDLKTGQLRHILGLSSDWRPLHLAGPEHPQDSRDDSPCSNRSGEASPTCELYLRGATMGRGSLNSFRTDGSAVRAPSPRSSASEDTEEPAEPAKPAGRDGGDGGGGGDGEASPAPVSASDAAPTRRLVEEPPIPIGPVRRGLPMTRRGVVQLLSQHQVVPASELGLAGASLKKRPRTRGVHAEEEEPQPQPAPPAGVFDWAEALGVSADASVDEILRAASSKRKTLRQAVTTLESPEEVLQDDPEYPEALPESSGELPDEAEAEASLDDLGMPLEEEETRPARNVTREISYAEGSLAGWYRQVSDETEIQEEPEIQRGHSFQPSGTKVRPRSAAMLYIQNLELVNGKEETPQPSVQECPMPVHRPQTAPKTRPSPATLSKWERFQPCTVTKLVGHVGVAPPKEASIWAICSLTLVHRLRFHERRVFRGSQCT